MAAQRSKCPSRGLPSPSLPPFLPARRTRISSSPPPPHTPTCPAPFPPPPRRTLYHHHHHHLVLVASSALPASPLSSHSFPGCNDTPLLCLLAPLSFFARAGHVCVPSGGGDSERNTPTASSSPSSSSASRLLPRPSPSPAAATSPSASPAPAPSPPVPPRASALRRLVRRALRLRLGRWRTQRAGARSRLAWATGEEGTRRPAQPPAQARLRRPSTARLRPSQALVPARAPPPHRRLRRRWARETEAAPRKPVRDSLPATATASASPRASASGTRPTRRAPRAAPPHGGRASGWRSSGAGAWLVRGSGSGEGNACEVWEGRARARGRRGRRGARGLSGWGGRG